MFFKWGFVALLALNLLVSVRAQEEDEEMSPEQLEEFGRFLVTQVGTMMCYRSWEIDPTVDFHECNVCFNTTRDADTREGFVQIAEECHTKYLDGTDYQECMPFLKNPNLPNKPYDILVSEPPFEFSYRSYARCSHGVVFRQEAHRCVGDFEDVHGLDPFLEKFSCLLNNLIAEAKRFSEANREELLNSVPRS